MNIHPDLIERDPQTNLPIFIQDETCAGHCDYACNANGGPEAAALAGTNPAVWPLRFQTQDQLTEPVIERVLLPPLPPTLTLRLLATWLLSLPPEYQDAEPWILSRSRQGFNYINYIKRIAAFTWNQGEPAGVFFQAMGVHISDQLAGQIAITHTLDSEEITQALTAAKPTNGWHILAHNPDDLPDSERWVQVKTPINCHPATWNGCTWISITDCITIRSVLAWHELPQWPEN